jgi:RNA polymerase sigma-70 factor (ECF subfamily)
MADTPGPDELAVKVERAEAVRRALLRLSEPYRVVVALRHYEGLRFHEVAEVLGIPVGTVKSRMAEALERLEIMLRPWA